MKKLSVICGFLVLLFLPVPRAVQAQNTFSSTTGESATEQSTTEQQFASVSPAVLQDMLRKKQLIVIDNSRPGNPQCVTVMTLFNAPVEKVFSIITDYDHYAGNIPQMTAVKVVRKTGNDWIVSYKLKFKISIFTEHVNYTLKQVLDPPRSVTWTRKVGNAEKAEGWTLIPIDNGTKTIGFYKVFNAMSSVDFLLRYILENHPVLNMAILTSSALVYTEAMQKWVDRNAKEGLPVAPSLLPQKTKGKM